MPQCQHDSCSFKQHPTHKRDGGILCFGAWQATVSNSWVAGVGPASAQAMMRTGAMLLDHQEALGDSLQST